MLYCCTVSGISPVIAGVSIRILKKIFDYRMQNPYNVGYLLIHSPILVKHPVVNF